MKSGKHPERKLTAVKVRNETRPGRYTDGNGLYLVIDPSGARRWLLRIVIKGQRRDLGLGGVSLVSLAEAREKALAFRKIAREGGDPVADSMKKRDAAPAFKDAAELVHQSREAGFRNSKHAAQWISTLRTYANPILGNLTVSEISTSDILRVLSPIWLSKAETARRVLQRIGAVLDWAKAAGYRANENPIGGVKQGLPKQGSRKSHHAAMPFKDVPAFVAYLQTTQGFTASHVPLEFLILTAVRTNEALGATWTEIDEASATWTIPGERMKAHREHRVPLVPRALELLKKAREMSPTSDYVFVGRNINRPMSNMTLLEVLRRADLPFTVHGFRSSFRDWAGETTAHPADVCEMALAHTIKNKAEAAYRRGDMFDKRRELMQDWSAFLAVSRRSLKRTFVNGEIKTD